MHRETQRRVKKENEKQQGERRRRKVGKFAKKENKETQMISTSVLLCFLSFLLLIHTNARSKSKAGDPTIRASTLYLWIGLVKPLGHSRLAAATYCCSEGAGSHRRRRCKQACRQQAAAVTLNNARTHACTHSLLALTVKIKHLFSVFALRARLVNFCMHAAYSTRQTNSLTPLLLSPSSGGLLASFPPSQRERGALSSALEDRVVVDAGHEDVALWVGVGKWGLVWSGGRLGHKGGTMRAVCNIKTNKQPPSM